MITFESVSKTYPDRTTAVADLELELPSDQISIVVGPSGCGKTTTLRMINRMIEPTQGTISWDGRPLRSMRKTTLRRQMGYVIQNGGLFPHRTVLDNICTVPTLLGWSRAKSRGRALELLGLVGLDRALAHRFPAQLSGGQQQRVGVARALAADPVLLLMDEPFSAVDPVVRADLQQLVTGLQRDLGKTIVMITHDIDEAMLMGDQVVIMRVGGRIAQAGTPDEILDRPADEFVESFVGRDRGFRALSFAPASGLSIGRIRSVRSAASAGGSSPAVVVDADGRPLGWADGSRPGVMLPLGATFSPEKDSLRAVVDAALSSPVGLAVAVQASGRLAGVVSAKEAMEAVRLRRLSVADEHAAEQAAAATSEPDTARETDTGAGMSLAAGSGSAVAAESPTAPESEAAVEPETAAEPETASGSEAADSAGAAELETSPEREVEATPAGQVPVDQPEPSVAEPTPEPEPTPESGLEPTPDSEPESTPEPKPVAELQPDLQPEHAADPEGVADTEGVAAAGDVPATEGVAAAEDVPATGDVRADQADPADGVDPGAPGSDEDPWHDEHAWDDDEATQRFRREPGDAPTGQGEH